MIVPWNIQSFRDGHFALQYATIKNFFGYLTIHIFSIKSVKSTITCMILIEDVIAINKFTIFKNVQSFHIPTTIDIEVKKWQTMPICFGSFSYELKIHLIMCNIISDIKKYNL